MSDMKNTEAVIKACEKDPFVYFATNKLAQCELQSDLTICSKCMSPFMDMIEHFASSCSATGEVHDKFWTSIIDIFGIRTYVYLDNLYSSSTAE